MVPGVRFHGPHLRSEVCVLINESFFLGDWVLLGARKRLLDWSQLMSPDKPDKRGQLEMLCACGPISKDRKGHKALFPPAVSGALIECIFFSFLRNALS